MAKVTATEANRNFSKLLADVRKGRTAEITVRGEVVARLERVTPQQRRSDKEREKSWEKLIDRLRSQKPLGVPRGTRDELYDDE
jgi:antitoxin (DNA-binding transcriptional repressor) of toxin-antitoxin stability system